VTTDCNKRSS